MIHRARLSWNSYIYKTLGFIIFAQDAVIHLRLRRIGIILPRGKISANLNMMPTKSNPVSKKIGLAIVTMVAWIPLTYAMFFIFAGAEDSNIHSTSPLYYWFVRIAFDIITFPMRFLGHWDTFGFQTDLAVFLQILLNGLFWWCMFLLLYPFVRRLVSLMANEQQPKP